MKIYSFYDDAADCFGLYKYTWEFALTNVVGKDGHVRLLESEVGNCHDHQWKNLPRTDEKCVLFTIFDNRTNQNNINNIFDRMPNCRLILNGGDIVYLDGMNLRFEPDDRILITEPMNKVVKKLQEKGYNAANYYWTISQSVVDFAKNLDLQNDRSYDLMCLCKPGNNDRQHLFASLKNSGVSLKYNLGITDLEKILELYSEAWGILGTTTGSLPGWNHRSMKGFRDWLAPLAGTVLIYDDYDEIIEMGGENLFPLYEYMHVKRIREILHRLKTDGKYYREYVEKQREWLSNHTMEKQLATIFKMNGIL